ncbi:MAG: DUF853 family protein [Nanoarchaeota archaeon]|nr:DUF853 family protein [Nanoarchaeota archaeon]
MADAILGRDMKYPLETLKKHFICLGSTGSGKTVLSKALIEEAAINGIPSIIVDPQGDLASLAMPGTGKNVDKERLELFQKNARVVVFTPTSSKGIPLCVNPLKLPKKNIDSEDAVSVLNQISSSVTKLIGYDLDKDAGKNSQAVLYLLLHDCWKKEIHLTTFDGLSSLVLNAPENVRKEGEAFFNDAKALAQLAKKLKFLTIGEKELMFQSGAQLDMDMLLGKGKGKTQISVIYLNSLETMEEKQFFASMLATELYQWMLSNPSKELQALFLIDEVSSYIPAGAEKPMAKEILKLVYKQARKYGVGCITGTQNPGDIDYKAFAQFGTWALGRMVTKQDIAKVKTALEAVGAEKAEKVLSSLPSLKPGQFFMFCPDLFRDVKEFSVRWLLTEHKTLTDDDVKKITTPETRAMFKLKEAKAAKKEGGIASKGGAAHLAVNVSKADAQAMIEKKKKRMFLFFGPKRETLESFRLVALPLLRVHAFTTKKGIFKDRTERFTLYFDAVEGNLAALDAKGNIKFFETSKLLSLNETELRVLKAIIEMGDNATHAEISSKLGITETAVNDAANVLMRKHLVSLSGRKKEQGRAYLWESVPMKVPLKLKKAVSEEAEVSNSKEEWQEQKPSVNEKNIAVFLRAWLGAGIEDSDIVYYPYYEVKLFGKKKRRLLKISAVSGKEIE